MEEVTQARADELRAQGQDALQRIAKGEVPDSQEIATLNQAHRSLDKAEKIEEKLE